MNTKEIQSHLEDIKNELGLLLFHEQTLTKEIELAKPKFESSIVRPRTTNIRNMTNQDMEIDVVQIGNANKEVIEARKTYYYASVELAQVKVAILAKKELYNSYKMHVKQEVDKQSKPCTDEMIYDVYTKASGLNNLSAEEADALKGITRDLPKILNSGKEKRVTLYETLQNMIAMHQ
jgi:hypothetical protein